MLPQGMENNMGTAQTQSPPVLYRGTWRGRHACREEVTLYTDLQMLLAPPTVRAGFPECHILVAVCHVLGREVQLQRQHAPK